MLIIRLSRIGKRNHAQYKVVLVEKSFPVKGKFIEQFGSYDPHLKVANLKSDRIKYWIGQGVACSDTVFNLFVKEGILEAEKRKVTIRGKKNEEGESGEKKEPGNEDEKEKEESSNIGVTKEAKEKKEDQMEEEGAEEKKGTQKVKESKLEEKFVHSDEIRKEKTDDGKEKREGIAKEVGEKKEETKDKTDKEEE